MTKIGNLFKGDTVIWIVFFFLCMISLVEVYSAGSTLTYKSGSYVAPLINQAVTLLMGAIVVFVFHRIPCKYFKLIPVIGVPLIMIALLFVLMLGDKVNGGARWTTLFGISIQPSEIAKGVLVSAVALILALGQTEDGTDNRVFKYILYVTAAICGLIFPENFSTAALLGLVVVLMMFIGRVPLIKIGGLLGVLALIALSGFLLLKNLPSDSFVFDLPGLHRASTWKTRLSTFGDDKVITPEEFDIDKNGQIAHANIAIATSNFVGKMPGNSEQRDFLSQAFSDFIYAIIIEETGLWGAAAVLLLYLVLLNRASRIARRCTGGFPAFFVLGLALLLVLQAFVNMMVAVGVMPVTGQTLPLISRGGSSILCSSWYIGMMLSISVYAERNAKLQAETNHKGLTEDEPEVQE